MFYFGKQLKRLQTACIFTSVRSLVLRSTAIASISLGGALGASALLSGCSSDQASEQELKASRGFDYSAMLAHYADALILPRYQKAHNEVLELQTITDNYCAALLGDAQNASPIMQEAQVQWRETISAWQYAEMLWLGPLLENELALRNRIYGFGRLDWANSCAVDVSAASVDDADFNIALRANNTRGLDALEYLLFNENLDHTCSDLVQKTETWNARPEAERKQARCQLAQAVVGNVAEHTEQLVQAWSPQGDNYRSLFLNANNAGEHLSQLSDALFYLDKEVKDLKLGLPLAQAGNCQGEACPGTIESRFANISAEMMIDNLKAFKTLFNGGEGLGFDDIIRFEGFDDVSRDINANVDVAINFAQSLAAQKTLFTEASEQAVSPDGSETCESISASANTQTQRYCTLHGLVKKIADQLRTDFVTIVNVDLPTRTQTDND